MMTGPQLPYLEPVVDKVGVNGKKAGHPGVQNLLPGYDGRTLVALLRAGGVANGVKEKKAGHLGGQNL